jgi:hypothetical protein
MDRKKIKFKASRIPCDEAYFKVRRNHDGKKRLFSACLCDARKTGAWHRQATKSRHRRDYEAINGEKSIKRKRPGS